MKLAAISFTGAGGEVCVRLARELARQGHTCSCYGKRKEVNQPQETSGLCMTGQTVAEWTRQRFGQVDGLIYIGAAGIAVRAVAPCLRDKMTDPAVVVVDEAAHYAISLLSGHVGGANDLAVTVAHILGAQPVVTTATDVRGKQAIDGWAARRGLAISDRELAKQVAVALLEERPVGFYSDYPLDGPVPEGYGKGELGGIHVWVTARVKPAADDLLSLFLGEGGAVLRLIPRSLSVGVGCRKGVPLERIDAAVLGTLAEHNLDMRAVGKLCSIDLKKQEPGLCSLAKLRGTSFQTFSAEELGQAEGSEAESPFVRQVTGVGNVCERAALLGAGPNGRLVVKKQAADGVTVAVAERMMRIGTENR